MYVDTYEVIQILKYERYTSHINLQSSSTMVTVDVVLPGVTGTGTSDGIMITTLNTSGVSTTSSSMMEIIMQLLVTPGANTMVLTTLV